MPEINMIFRFSNGEQYDIPAWHIVAHYALTTTRMRYLRMLQDDDPEGEAEEILRVSENVIPSNETWDEFYDEAIDEICERPDILGVYARSLPWSYVSKHARRLDVDIPYDYESAWGGVAGGRFEVLEHSKT